MKTSTFSLLSRFTVASLALAITWADTDTSQANEAAAVVAVGTV